MIDKKVIDERHANLMNKWLSMMERNTPKSVKIETEYYFNYYGERGYIDIIDFHDFDLRNKRYSHINITEIKPIIDDVGNLIRQIKKYRETIPKVVRCKEIGRINIVVEFNAMNIQIVRDYFKILQKGLGSFEIYFVKNTIPMRFDCLSVQGDSVYCEDELKNDLGEFV